ncbi:hypothetical protein O7627_32175 [Solwaraspora sp. WMMD1047]|uniref:hypothetical protein n=1 Tax=Solwaraspora sp. WMMD1047 TaxID=3016102 RepID=UPI002417CF88|nr:hypothetical protein [Solwaraspora sp. WMMD1047]MDG4833928.1 hypothetical protein [Solwaraspora sp. WMMD1047]
MRLYPQQPVPPDREITLADPRVRDLDRATSRAYAVLGEAIETAALRGVPVEIIAKYTSLPLDEVSLALTDTEEAAAPA